MRLLIFAVAASLSIALVPPVTPAGASTGDNTAHQWCYYIRHQAMLTGDPKLWAKWRACLKDWGSW